MNKAVLNPTYLENSGYSLKEYPNLQLLLEDLYMPFVAILASCLFVWVILSLDSRTLSYQIKRIAFALVISVFWACVFSMHA